MAAFEIIEETEAGTGWLFKAQAIDAAGGLHSVMMSLSWADYNLWSRDGGVPPIVVAEAAFAFLLDVVGVDAMKAKFDASIARRIANDADHAIQAMIRRNAG